MIDLLRKSVEEYDIEKAIVIGRNLINQDPNDREAVQCYLDFLFELAGTLPVIEERREFLNQGKLILSFIEENAKLDPEYLDWLVAYSEKASEIEKDIIKSEEEKIKKIVSEIELANNKALMKIHDLCDSLKLVTTQERFDELMKEFIEIDREIEKDYFTKIDQKQYEQLSKLCSDIISERMQVIERNKNIDYNNEAITSYKAAYQDFCKSEATYKSNLSSLMYMLKDRLFSFDTNRLFPETIIYYQEIYKHIFDRLSDEGKELITRTSINSNKA